MMSRQHAPATITDRSVTLNGGQQTVLDSGNNRHWTNFYAHKDNAGPIAINLSGGVASLAKAAPGSLILLPGGALELAGVAFSTAVVVLGTNGDSLTINQGN